MEKRHYVLETICAIGIVAIVTILATSSYRSAAATTTSQATEEATDIDAMVKGYIKTRFGSEYSVDITETAKKRSVKMARWSGYGPYKIIAEDIGLDGKWDTIKACDASGSCTEENPTNRNTLAIIEDSMILMESKPK
jgi:hypothetical protein